MEQPTELSMLIDALQTFGLFIWLVAAVVMAAYTATVAASKGHSGMMWGLGGLLFGLVALLAAVGLGDKRELVIEGEERPRRRSKPTTSLNPYS